MSVERTIERTIQKHERRLNKRLSADIEIENPGFIKADGRYINNEKLKKYIDAADSFDYEDWYDMVCKVVRYHHD